MKSTNKSKIYKKDYRKVASYASVSIEDMAQLTQKITELQEDVTKQYPEATDFKVKFEIEGGNTGNTVVKLTFNRYETSQEVAAARKTYLRMLTKFLILLIVFVGITGFWTIVNRVYYFKPIIKEKVKEASDKQDSAKIGSGNVETNSIVENTPNQEDTPNQEETSPKKKLRDIKFYNEQDVYLYLHTYKFKGDNGWILDFKDVGRTLYINDKCIYTDVRIKEFRENSAWINVSGPYGGDSFMIIIEDWGHSIFDINDNTYYDEMN